MFDVGRVIVRVDVHRALAALGAAAHLSSEQVCSAINAEPRKRDFQEGRLPPRRWHEHLSHRLGFGLTFEQFCAAWNSALVPETILREELFAQLAPRYRLALLSNTDPIHVAHLEGHFSFVRHFPVRVYSCVAGASKPDAAIYARAIEGACVAPQEILYIDDAAEFVEAGRRAGMEAVIFDGAEQLLEELRRRGILEP